MAIQATSEEQLKFKKRARQRLIGAGALLLTAAIVLPLVLDATPRQKSAEVAINMVNPVAPGKPEVPVAPPAIPAPIASPAAIADIPATPEVTKLPPSQPQATTAHLDAGMKPSPDEHPVVNNAAPTVAKADESSKSKVAVQSKTDVKTVAKPEPKVEAKPKPEAKKPDTKVELKVEPKVEPKVESKNEPKASDSAHVKAAQNTQHFVVQLGAFSNMENVQQLRDRLSAVGVTTYTEKLPSGATRVRVGPYADRAQADKVLAKINAAGVQAQVVPLK